MSPALMSFGAGREKRLYAVPPYAWCEPLTITPLQPALEECCAFCGSHDSYLTN
jgi:alpha-D-ribose 1-methylphosphonate 5-phosphate C-P lyase